MGQAKKKQDPCERTMSLEDHLEELRARLIFAIIGVAVGAIVCLVFGTHLIRFIEMPYNNLRGEYSLEALKVLAPADAFAVYMRISLIGGLILSSPWVFISCGCLLQLDSMNTKNDTSVWLCLFRRYCSWEGRCFFYL